MRGEASYETQGFGAACRLAARAYRKEAAALLREGETDARADERQAWLEAAEDALRAEAIYRAVMQPAREKAIRLLAEAGLPCFAAALETGEYAKHLGF